ncbi:MAG: hypothetical protein CL946_12655 [Ectothiorhodospiraceae bacterium]|nr:hypothetical protein [Ectothiorhodospiraceae bacterium]
MKPEEIDDYISALVDKDHSGLTKEELDELRRLLREYPQHFGEYQLDIATKLCVMKHVRNVECPKSTSSAIKKSLLQMLDAMQDGRKPS